MYYKFIKHVYYPLTQALKGQSVLKYLRKLEESQWYSAERLEKMQWERLPFLLKHAYERVPYYRKKFQKIGLEPESIKSYNDFLKIPILTKEEVSKKGVDLMGPTYSGKIYRGRTSGSTGLAVETLYDSEFESWTSASQWRARRWFRVDIGDKGVAIWGRPVYSTIERHIGPIKTRLKHVMLLSAFNLSEKVLESYWKRIKAFHPTYFYGYATAIYQLAQYVKKREGSAHGLNLKAVFSTAETLHQYQRNLIESIFSCKVANKYGCSELGNFAYECPEGRMHISAENVFVEFLQQGKPATSGEIGEIIVTGLTNRCMPLIRYKIGDKGIPTNDVCSCGRRLPLMELTAAKITEMIITPEGEIFSSELLDYINLGLMHKRIKGIKQFRVIQKSEGIFLVEIVRNTEFSFASVEFFKRKMKEFIGEDIKIDIEFVKEIPREKTGKLRYFVSELERET